MLKRENSGRDRLPKVTRGVLDSTPLWLREDTSHKRGGRVLGYPQWVEKQMSIHSVYGRCNDELDHSLNESMDSIKNLQHSSSQSNFKSKVV